ncbi:MAG: hypothetical protein WAU62_12280 [Dehalococcoidales bacterium]
MNNKGRLLTHSEKMIPFSSLQKVSNRLKLISGSDASWEKIEIYDSRDILISKLQYDAVHHGSTGETTLKDLETGIQDNYPVNARLWLKKYFATVHAIYTFSFFPDFMDKNSWPILGGIENFLKDSLTGIIQADNEGYYNEAGLYILYQMYEGATGNVTAVSLNDKGEWGPYSYSLKLDDKKSVELFKQGIPPKQGFFARMFGL